MLYVISSYVCLIFFCIGIKYRYISPLPAKLLFKVGKKDQVKFPIGVTTNSLEEILVADTGNHVVRLFDPEGKFLRDIGREVPVFRTKLLFLHSSLIMVLIKKYEKFRGNQFRESKLCVTGSGLLFCYIN